LITSATVKMIKLKDIFKLASLLKYWTNMDIYTPEKC